MSQSAWGGIGRPSPVESDRRRRELLRLLAAGMGWKQAAAEARVSPKTVLALLDEQEFWTVAKALRDGRGGLVAVTVAAETDTLAA